MRRSFVSLPRHFTSVSFSFSRACVYTSFDRLTHTHTRQIEHDAAMLTHWYRSYTYTVSTNWSYFLCLLFFFFFHLFRSIYINNIRANVDNIYIYVIYMYVYILKKIQVAKLNRKQAPPPKILLIVSYMWDVCTSESIINWEEKKKKKKRGRNKYK